MKTAELDFKNYSSKYAAKEKENIQSKEDAPAESPLTKSTNPPKFGIMTQLCSDNKKEI